MAFFESTGIDILSTCNDCLDLSNRTIIMQTKDIVRSVVNHMKHHLSLPLIITGKAGHAIEEPGNEVIKQNLFGKRIF